MLHSAPSSSRPPPPLSHPDEAASAANPPPSIKTDESTQQAQIKGANRRAEGVEIAVPVVHGTVAFHLGRKATDSQSHKWTVYVRSATNEDLSVVVKHVVFMLHDSFSNPVRVVKSPPFEVTEYGWGEFEIAISLFFHSDVGEKQLNLFHLLKLYPEDDAGAPHSIKKPVVVESYNEIVFPDPYENFLARVRNYPAVIVPRLPMGLNLPVPVPIENAKESGRRDTKANPLNQWFMNFSEADELLKLASARQQVQAHIAKLRRQLSVIDGPPQLSSPVSCYDS